MPFTADVLDRHAGVGLFEDRDDLRLGELRFLHGTCWLGSDARKFYFQDVCLAGELTELKSRQPIERQARVTGAIWLGEQLIDGGKGLGDVGFGAEVKDALRQRADFLAEQGLAEHRGQRVVLARNPLVTLRGRELV